jgi:hypothetical protein
VEGCWLVVSDKDGNLTAFPQPLLAANVCVLLISKISFKKLFVNNREVFISSTILSAKTANYMTMWEGLYGAIGVD